MIKTFAFPANAAIDAGYDVTYFDCRVLCAKVVGATSSEGFLVYLLNRLP